jgi:hypothetical protein
MHLFVVAIRTNLFATRSLRVGTCVLVLRVSEACWEYPESYVSHITHVS